MTVGKPDRLPTLSELQTVYRIMSRLAELQQQFMRVLQGDNPAQLADAIVTQGSVSTLTRINIYCNALSSSTERKHGGGSRNTGHLSGR